MMGITKQDRTDKGMWWDRAWGLTAGCEKLSPGCLHCWAEKESHIRSHQKNPGMQYRWGGVTTPDGKWTGKIRLLEQNLSLPITVKKPTSWAIWNDLFHEDVSLSFQYEAFKVMLRCPQHFFFILTKRAELMKERTDEIYGFLKDCYFRVGKEKAIYPLPNVMLMVTTENQDMADKRIPYLLQTQAALRGISAEPLLGALNLMQTTYAITTPHPSVGGIMHRPHAYLEHLNGVIVGGESGTGARQTDIEHIRSIRDQCKVAGVSFFLKQMHVDGKLVKMPELDGRRHNELPEARE